MSNIYHTPISFNAIADDDTFNDPLGQLDLAIDDVKSVVDGHTAELSAARDPYISLDERLDAMSFGYAGGNIATKTNGTADAGQKVVTVLSTEGFLSGAYAAYTLVDGTVEYNLIAAVTDATHLLLTTNIGEGGIGDGIYIGLVSVSEYQAANSFYHGATAITLPDATARLNRGDYYVKLTPGASAAVNTAAIVHAVAASTAGNYGAVVLPPGEFYVTGDVITLARVEATNRACPIFRGAGRGVTKLVLEPGDDGAILTITGSWQIKDMSFVGNEIAPGGLGAEGIGAFVRRMTEGGGFFDCNFSVFEFGILTDIYQAFEAGSAMQGTTTERCMFEACSEAGFWIDDVQNANHVTQCVFMNGYPSVVGNKGFGLYIGGISSNMIVEKCQFLSHKHGLVAAGTTGLVIRNNYFETVWAESGGYILLDGLAENARSLVVRRQTLANGATSSGQKTVTVDSTALLYAGQYVYYTLVGGVIERNRIEYVDSGTQIRLFTNIGAGGIPNNGPVTGIEFNENVLIESNVCSFHYTSGTPTHTFLQVRDTRQITVKSNWSTSYGAGLIDMLDDEGNPISTVRGLAMEGNYNSYNNTKMLVDDVMADGAVVFRHDVSSTDSFNIPQIWLGKNLFTVPDKDGIHSLALTADGTLVLYADDTGVQIKQGATIGDGGRKITKYLANVEATLDFGSIPAHSTAELNFAFTGAAINDQVIIAPIWVIEAGLMWGAYVNVANYVTVRLANVTAAAINPASGTWAISVIKH